MTDLYAKALEIAIIAHEWQRDKGGHPYIMHPINVAEMCDNEIEKVVALLHDVVEDTDWSLKRLGQEGFSPVILSAVDAVTHRKGEPRRDYLDRCKANPIAKAVKLADLRHNSDLRRISPASSKDVLRFIHYQRNIGYMLDLKESKEYKDLYRWEYDGFVIRQTSTYNSDGSIGAWVQHLVTKDNSLLKITHTLYDAVEYIKTCQQDV